MDCSLPGSSVHGILKARILEWIAMPSSKGSSWPRDQTSVSYVYLHWQVGSLPLTPSRSPQSPLHQPVFCIVLQFSSVQSLSRVQLFATPWTTACQASLSITNLQASNRPFYLFVYHIYWILSVFPCSMRIRMLWPQICCSELCCQKCNWFTVSAPPHGIHHHIGIEATFPRAAPS